MRLEPYKLLKGWVIRSPHFAHGDFEPKAPIDASRGQALFQVIEDIRGESCDHTFSCCYWTIVTAQRLKADGTNDPNGERITFVSSGLDNDPYKEVEIVGQMSHDGSAVTYTLPKP